jgi:hypothetical protein
VIDLKKVVLTAGHSMVELVLVMFLLILFSVSTLSLVASSSDAYVDIVRKKDTLSSLRVAQSYIYTKVRQNLAEDAISLRQYRDIEGTCLVVEDRSSDIPYETIIFVKDGQLRETLLLEDTQFDPEESFVIVGLDGLNLELIEGKGISFETILTESGKEERLQGFVALLVN